MEQEIKDGLQKIEEKVVTNSYVIDTLKFYCDEHSEIEEVSQAASVLEVISKNEREILNLVANYKDSRNYHKGI